CRNPHMPTDHRFVDNVVLARFSRPLGQLRLALQPESHNRCDLDGTAPVAADYLRIFSGLQQTGYIRGLERSDKGRACLEANVVQIDRRDVAVLVPPGSLAGSAVERLQLLATTLRGNAVLGQQG